MQCGQAKTTITLKLCTIYILITKVHLIKAETRLGNHKGKCQEEEKRANQGDSKQPWMFRMNKNYLNYNHDTFSLPIF